MLHTEEFFSTARERERIRLRRAAGEAWPWTEDPILRVWRFCNVRREDDRTTVWFRENVRSRLAGLPLLRSTVIFRWFNRVETGERILSLLLGKWSSRECRRLLRDVQPVVTGAYMLKTPTGMTKLDGTIENIETILPLLPEAFSTWSGQSLEEAWDSLRVLPGLGPFTAYEVVSDLRRDPILSAAADVNSWANAGPGCRRGLGRVLAGDVERYRFQLRSEGQEVLDHMRGLLAMSRDPGNWPAEWGPWEMREVEHWLCEYDKYCRVEEGGTLKRKYPSPAAEAPAQEEIAWPQ